MTNDFLRIVTLADNCHADPNGTPLAQSNYGRGRVGQFEQCSHGVIRNNYWI